MFMSVTADDGCRRARELLEKFRDVLQNGWNEFLRKRFSVCRYAALFFRDTYQTFSERSFLSRVSNKVLGI